MSKISDIINDHLKFLFAIGFGGALVLETTNSWPQVDLPVWSELVAQIAIIGIIAGYLGGGKIWDLLPEQFGTFLVCIEGDNTDRIEVWELTDDQFEDLVVEGGPLNHLAECKHEAYEVVSYDREANKATATWRKSKENSEIVGQTTVSDALDEISELRGPYEKLVRRSDAIVRRIDSIIRTLDRQRAKDQNKALRGHTTPSLDGPTVREVINEQLGDLAPDHLSDDEQTDEVTDELIDDLGPLAGAGEGEALEPEPQQQPASGDD